MEDWKNNRAEAEMKIAEVEIMKKAAKAKKEAIDKEWDLIKEHLYVGSGPEDDSIDWVIDEMRKKYEFPVEIKK